MTATPKHLNLVAGGREPDATPIAVIAGGDAQRQHAALNGSHAVVGALTALGCEPHIVHAGASLAHELEDSGAKLAVVTVLDDRLADGTVQELCGDIDVACVGAPPSALRSCADKVVARTRMAEHDVAVPPQRQFTRAAVVAAGIGAILPHAIGALGASELVIKPRHGSGGLGVKRVSAEGAAAAIVNTFNYDDAIVIERVVEGEELTVLMTGDSADPLAVGIARVDYVSDDRRAAAWARRYAPAGDLSRDLLHTAVQTARSVASALGLSALATVDMIVDADGTAWAIDADCMLDWRPDGALAACVASSGLTEAQLLASLLRDLGAAPRLAA